MEERKAKLYRAYPDDEERIAEFSSRHHIESSAQFMHFIAEHLDLIELAFNSSQLATDSIDGLATGNVSQLGTHFPAGDGSRNISPVGNNFASFDRTDLLSAVSASMAALQKFPRPLHPDIFVTADLAFDARAEHVRNVTFGIDMTFPSLFPEPVHWSLEQRQEYYNRLRAEWDLYGNAAIRVEQAYDGRRDLPEDYKDRPKIKTKYGYIPQVFLEYHPWYVHPEWCDYHLLRELDHERILFPELDGPEGTQQVLEQLDAHPMQGPLRDMRFDPGEVKSWLV